MSRFDPQEKIKILTRLTNYCHYWLNYDKSALRYLRETRKLTDETIKRFRIGAFPTISQLLTKFSLFELQVSGVVREDEETGTNTSKFTYNRLVFPVQDLYGQTVAVMGRTLLSDAEQERLCVNKYDGTIFAKSRVLYGLNLAKDTIREKSAVMVVEGAFDVISAHQAGFKNVVGSLGAFFHPNQAALLARYAGKIALGLDADEAGRAAIERVLRRGVEGVGLSVKNVPDGKKDWDEYFRGRVR